MRDIKFRYWTGLKMEHNVVVGALGAFYALIDPNDSACLSPTTKYYTNEYLMQFTGLHDKEGKEIWEGDIVECDYNDEVLVRNVVFSHGYFGLDRGSNIKPALLFALKDCCKVIGNIYNNPDLLKI